MSHSETGSRTLEERSATEERRAERRAATTFLVSAVAAVMLGFVYANGGQPQLEGLLLATSMGAMGTGLVIWANRLLPQGPAVEAREELATLAGGDARLIQERHASPVAASPDRMVARGERRPHRRHPMPGVDVRLEGARSPLPAGRGVVPLSKPCRPAWASVP